MTCTNCGRSALGTATNGLPYCERTECCDWKAERLKAQQERQRSIAVIVAAAVESRLGRTAL